MADTTLRRIKRVYRRRLEPWVRATATRIFRIAVNGAVRVHLLPTPARLRRGEQERFLIINPAGHLGDTIMLLPMILALRKAYPEARIECALEAAAAPILRPLKEIDRVYALPLGSVPPVGIIPSTLRAFVLTRLYWQMMRHSLPTTCIVARWGDDLFRATTLAYLTQAPRRIGFTSDSNGLAHSSAPYRDALLTEAVHGGQRMHEAIKFLYLLEQTRLISPTGDIAKQAIPALRQVTQTVQFDTLAKKAGMAEGKPFAIVAPGASMLRRVWPLQRWIRVVEALLERGLDIVLLAGPSDAAISAELRDHLSGALRSDDFARVHLVAGITSLEESANLISQATIFLGNDSGPGHLAGAMGVPTIVTAIGSMDADPDAAAVPERIHPLGPLVITCRPLHALPPCPGVCVQMEQHCIKSITTESVLEALVQLLPRKPI